MPPHLIAEAVLERQGGVATSRDFEAAGISAANVVSLCNRGYLERIRRGYYQRAGATCPPEEQLLATLLPQAIVCGESALFHWGYSDFTPRSWSIAVPRDFSRSKLSAAPLPLAPQYVTPQLFELGATTSTFNGYTLRAYDRERTICDCVRFKNRLDSELFAKALTAYARDPHKNLSNLTAYAQRLRVAAKLTPLLEVLLNG
jgi:predicted transcriptional regulator of viral defense system